MPISGYYLSTGFTAVDSVYQIRLNNHLDEVIRICVCLAKRDTEGSLSPVLVMYCKS